MGDKRIEVDFNMSKNSWNCPIVICTFNRPKYLKRCLESIFSTPDIKEHGVPVYVFCDGGEESTPQENADILKEFPLVTKVFIQTENLCIPRHIHYMRKVIFDEMGYDRLAFVEDDILVSPYYYRVMNRVFDIYETFDSTVGVVNSSMICLESLSEKIHKQRDFSDALSHLNNYVMSKNTWDKIQPVMQEYLDLFIEPIQSYRDINHEAVIDWIREKITNSTAPLAKERRIYIHLTSSQDSITNIAMRVNNLRYVCSYVNRILNIGEEGYHFEPEYFKTHGLDRMVLDIMPMDAGEIKNIWDMDYFGVVQVL